MHKSVKFKRINLKKYTNSGGQPVRDATAHSPLLIYSCNYVSTARGKKAEIILFLFFSIEIFHLKRIPLLFLYILTKPTNVVLCDQVWCLLAASQQMF